MQKSLGSALSLLGREALRIVLPAWCVVCRAELPWRDRVASCCGACWRALPKIAIVKCRSCALPLPGSAHGAICIECSADPLPLHWCESWGEYRDALEGVLRAFKFERHDFLDTPLSDLLAATLRERGDVEFDAVVPVPMGRAKQRRRGYNQAELLARALAARVGLRCDPSLLARREERQTQSTLARAQRAANVRGVFAASASVSGKAILLVDDITTTGETFRSCAAALLDGGASRVCAIAVAKAT